MERIDSPEIDPDISVVYYSIKWPFKLVGKEGLFNKWC